MQQEQRRGVHTSRKPFHLPRTPIYYKNGEWLYNCAHCGEHRVPSAALRGLILVPYTSKT